MILDLFSGPRGWSEGLRKLGLTDVGIEWDHAACLTAQAAGHPSIRADVAAYPTGPFVGKVEGLIASPPCQDFSLAGKRAGIAGDRGQLVWQVLRWVDEIRPEWVACEQVPRVELIWRHFAHVMRGWGYRTAVGVIDAANYGVPQHRERAFLLAHRSRDVTLPAATHSATGSPGMFGELVPWVTVAEALGTDSALRHVRGSGMVERHGPRPDRLPSQPSFTVTSKARSWIWTEPSPTITTTRRSSAGLILGRQLPTGEGSAVGGHGWDGQSTSNKGGTCVPVTVAEASVLQSFRPDYPWQGSRSKQFEQIGNAVPPLLAAHVIAAVTGLPATDLAIAA